MTFEFIYTLTLLILMSVLLLKEWLEAEVTIFSTLLLLLLGGVIDLDQAFHGFSNAGMLTVAMLFIAAEALHSTGAIDQINELLFGRDNSSLHKKLARILFPVAGVSAFMNNTPIVALMIPAARRWTEKVGLSPSKFLIPISYAAILGGMCTLIGTSTNLIIYGLMINYGMPGMGMFELSVVGVPTALAGLLYILFIGQRLLKERKETIQHLQENSREFVIELKVTEQFASAGKTIAQAGLRHLKGLFLFQIERDGNVIAPAAPDEVIRLNDRLFFTGIPKTILELQKTPGLEVTKDAHFDLKQYDSARIKPFEAVVSPSSPLIGKNVRDSKFRQRYDAVIVAIHRNGERIKRKVGDIVIHSGDTLLLLGSKDFYDRFYYSPDFYLVSESERVPSKPRRKTLFAVGGFIGMILLVVLGVLPLLAAAGSYVVALLITKTLTLDEARRALDLRVLIIIASAFGLAEALKSSGVAEAIAHGVVLLGQNYGIVGVLSGIFILTSLFTNVLSNNATAALAFPIVYAAAQEIHADPRPFIIALAIAASASFATPISYQTNLMVFGPGGYSYRDFIKAGLPLQILVALLAIVLIYFIYF